MNDFHPARLPLNHYKNPMENRWLRGFSPQEPQEPALPAALDALGQGSPPTAGAARHVCWFTTIILLRIIPIVNGYVWK